MIRFLILLLIIPFLGIAQIATIGTASGCTDESVIVPVIIKNCDTVGAVSVNIAYNPQIIHLDTIQNISVDLMGAITNHIIENDSVGKIFFAWTAFGTYPVIDSSLLYELVFIYNGINAELLFDTISSEIANNNAEPLQTTWINGLIEASNVPSFNMQPLSRWVQPGVTTSFQIAVIPENPVYQWQEMQSNLEFEDLLNDGNISGVFTSTLRVSNPQLGDNGRVFRCKVSSCVDAFSDTAILNVDENNSTELISFSEIQITPQPAHNYLMISSKNSDIQNIKIFNITGDQVLNKDLNCMKTKLNISEYPKGIYIIEIADFNKRSYREKIILE